MNTFSSVTPEFRADADAVAAIRQGDRERYRELVERYADKVFAVAWSRLGDRDLAEEVAQEAFIKGYRRLALLGHAERFGSWIIAIARNAAINLGLRRRSELRKRERWALESSPEHEGTASSGIDQCHDKPMVETLRETLAALPAVHRECLVLFYIEGKSIAEAAMALGLSETAFKTRLHRARAALRNEMESRLEQDLRQLRPSASMASMIMLALPLGKPVWSVGGAIAAAAAKLSPAAGLSFLVHLLQMGPAIGVQFWMSKQEIENLRDRDGIRARNIVRIRNAMIAVLAVSVLVPAFINHVLDLRRTCQLFGVIAFASCLYGIRQLCISRHRNIVANVVGTSILGLAFLGMGFFGWNLGMLAFLQGVFFLFMSLMLDAQPLRSDLSIFIAAHAGTLPTDSVKHETPTVVTPTTLDELFAFGNFLGERMMAFDWRRGTDWLRLQLAPVTPTGCLGCFPAFWNDVSTLTLYTDGRVESHLGEGDRKSLSALSPGTSVLKESLESSVSRAALRALHGMRTGRISEAEQQLGAQPASTVYRKEPKKTVVARTRKWLLRAGGLLMIAEGVWISGMQRAVQLRAPATPPVPVAPSSAGSNAIAPASIATPVTLPASKVVVPQTLPDAVK